MKIGRNDPCPCGSGRKYKHCCLNKKRIIPFPEADNSILHSPVIPDSSIMNGLPPLHRMMGFDTADEYEDAFKKYTYYCENVLTDGDPVPTFREFTFGSSMAGSPFADSTFQDELRNASTLEKVEKIMEKSVNNYNNGIDAELDDGIVDHFIDMLEELVYEGPLKASSVVYFNKRIPVRDLRETPVMKIALSFLELIVRSNGMTVSRDGGLIEKYFKDFIDILEDQFLLEIYESNSKGVPLIVLWLDFIKIVLVEKKYITSNNSSISITDKGLKMLGSGGTKAFYFQLLQYITEKLNWFYKSSLPEAAGQLQDTAGVSMLFMHIICRREIYTPAEVLLKSVDSVLSVLDILKEDGITKKRAVEIYTDYFMEGYCRLMGFVRPVILEPKEVIRVEGKNYKKVYEPTQLFYEMFVWNM